MVLLLLVILAVLIWTIQVELEPSKKEKELVDVVCPACQHSVDIDLMVCPHCQQQLSEACSNCHRGKMINQHYCPFCGTDQKRIG